MSTWKTRVAGFAVASLVLGALADAQTGSDGRREHIVLDPALLDPSLLVALAPDGRVEVHESAFDEMAAAVLPLPIERRVAPSDLDLPFCDEIARGDITDVTFQIDPFFVRADAEASGTWCYSLSWEASVSAPAQVRLVDSGRAVQVTINPALATVTLDIPDEVDWLPGVPDKVSESFPVDLGQTLGAVPPLPVGSAEFVLETAAGTRTVTLTAQHVRLIPQDGFIELRGDVTLR